MSVLLANVRRLFAVFAMLSLAACGGGGGGGGGGGSDPGTASGLSVSPTSLTFSAQANSTLPTNQFVTLTVTASDAAYVVAGVPAGSSLPSWLTMAWDNSAPGVPRLRASITSTGLSPGTYNATLRVGITRLDNSLIAYRDVPVTYTVSLTPTLSVSPTNIYFRQSTGTAPATKSLTLSSSAGSVAWTGSISYTSGTAGWLSLNPASGSSLPATFNVNAQAMPAGTYQANISLSAAGATTQVPVTLVVKSAQVTFVSPYVATTNVSGSVIIRGFGFASMSNPAVTFGGFAATTVTVVSDTEIHATYPALAQGSYSLTISDVSQVLPNTHAARIVVVDAPAFAYTAIARPAGASSGLAPQNLIYDAERKAIYICDINLNGSTGQYTDRLERYRFNGTSWTTSTLISFAGISHNLNSRIALAPDGMEILKADYTSMVHVDPVNWLVTVNTPVGSAVGTAATLNLIGMTNDGGVIGNALPQGSSGVFYRYDLVDRTFVPLGAPSGLTGLINRTLNPSGDGSRLIVPSFGYLTSGNPLYYYDSGNYSFVDSGIATSYTSRVSMDRTGSRSIIQNINLDTVYNALFSPLGTLPSHDVSVVSPSGAYAYLFVANSSTIRKFDLTSSNGSGGFTEIGTGTIVPDAPGTGAIMTISPDGGTLVLAGGERVIIMPTP